MLSGGIELKQKIHKFVRNACHALAILSLWYEFARLSAYLIGSETPGAVFGLILIAWALSYKEEKSQLSQKDFNFSDEDWSKVQEIAQKMDDKKD